MPRISIGIPVYNSRDYILSCLDAVFSSPIQDLEVVVVDDGSTDGTASVVRERFPQVRLIVNDRNRGTNFSRKVILSEVSGLYFLRLDADTEVTPGAIACLADFLEIHPKVGVVGPKIVYPSGDPDGTSYGFQKVGAWRTFLDYSFVVWKTIRVITSKLRKTMIPSHPIQVDHLLGAAFMVRREAIRDAGVPSDNVIHYREETDWLYKISRAGWEIWYQPEAIVMHVGGSTSNDNETTYIHGQDRQLQSMWGFVHNNYPGRRNAFAFLVAIVCGSILSLLYALIVCPLGLFSAKVRKIVKRIVKTFGGVLVWHVKNMRSII